MMHTTLESASWKDRRVLLSGNTGFKGAWMALLLERLGAKVSALALAPETSPNMSEILSSNSKLEFTQCDIRDRQALQRAVSKAQPEIVIHMAAQALVKASYIDPVGTIESNVMGTVNLLEALRPIEGLKTVLVVTSDKVYENREAGIDFPETAPLGGHDPYSASKAAAEILTSAYRRSFFDDKGIRVVTGRAGNVIGGGDWASDRLIPDLWRAYELKTPVHLRNPNSVRPWQHVLDPLYGYLLYVQHTLSEQGELPYTLNFGPPRDPVRTARQVAQHFSHLLNATELWTEFNSSGQLHESTFLSIDSTLSANTLGWKTVLTVDEAIGWTSDWYKVYRDGQDMYDFTGKQIDAYAERVQTSALLQNSTAGTS